MAFVVVHDLLSGIENAPSGRAQFYLPGTLTALVIYGDDAGTTTGNPVTLDSNGRATVYLSQQARMIVKTVSGLTVLDTVINAEADAMVTNSSSAFTGDTQKDVNDSALTAFGGQDFLYQPAVGAYAGMTPKSWMSGVWANVMAYASSTARTVNDGVTPADAAVAAAVAAVQAAGGGVVYFPPGTYLMNAPIAVTGATAVSFKGAGLASSVIKNNASGNCITLTSCSSFFVEDLGITHSSSSTAAGIAISSGTSFRLVSVSIASHQIGVDVSAATTLSEMRSLVISTTSNAASRAIRYNLTGATSFGHLIYGGTLLASTSGKAIEFNGTVGRVVVIGTYFDPSNPTGILFNASLTGQVFSVAQCPSLFSLTTAFDISGLATDPVLVQTGNKVEGYVVSQASGGGGGSSHTPDRSKGPEVHVRLTSGGAAVCTLNAPTPAPTTGMRNTRLTLRLTAAAGGAITWTFNATYVLVGGGTTIAGADGSTIIVEFQRDVQTANWRECYRATTTT